MFWVPRNLSSISNSGAPSINHYFYNYATSNFLIEISNPQEESLQRLQKRIDVPYDSSIVQHQDALRALWNAAFPEEKLHGLISEQWKEMGWQGKDPSTYLGVVVLYHWRTFCSFLGISRN